MNKIGFHVYRFSSVWQQEKTEDRDLNNRNGEIGAPLSRNNSTKRSGCRVPVIVITVMPCRALFCGLHFHPVHPLIPHNVIYNIYSPFTQPGWNRGSEERKSQLPSLPQIEVTYFPTALSGKAKVLCWHLFPNKSYAQSYWMLSKTFLQNLSSAEFFSWNFLQKDML